MPLGFHAGSDPEGSSSTYNDERDTAATFLSGSRELATQQAVITASLEQVLAGSCHSYPSRKVIQLSTF
jgi:hypothetical protein